MLYVNCGCGDKFVTNREWVNLDFAQREGVQSCNILKGLPFENQSVDVIFSSCMLEHFTMEQAKSHIAECYRILKSNGVIRIVVPDLENVCKEYLKILDLVRKDETYQKKYEYIVIELLDQMTRMHSGGEMQKYWEDSSRDEEYILYRTGYPAGWREHKVTKKSRLKMYIAYKKHRFFSRFNFYNYFCLGRFMLSGETHKWMYDEYSLCRLLETEGFKNIRKLKCNESAIENWDKYGLEVTDRGNEYKPHSLYVEAKRQ